MAVIVTQTIPFPNKQVLETYLTRLKAQFRKYDPETGRPLFKTPANVVFRVDTNTNTAEILSNCVC